MALNITAEQYAQLQTYANAGDYAGGWSYLASIGDTYADNAYVVTTGNASSAIDQAFATLVEQHWNNTAGADAYQQYFTQVAALHFEQYVGFIGKSDNYSLPNSQQMEESYRKAVTWYGLPPEVAFDGVYSQTLGSLADALSLSQQPADYWNWTDWLGMEDARQVPSTVFNDLDPSKAWDILIKDVLNTTNALKDKGLDALGWNEFVKNAEKGFIKYALGLGDKINHIEDTVHDLFALGSSALYRIVYMLSPLVVDLNGDGVTTTAAGGTVYFDQDGNGIRTATGWAGPQDGLLVLDRNGNGTIDSGAELFGVYTPLAAGGTAPDGFAALKELDSNGDGIFDANDAQFANVQVWRDANQDGVTDAGELLSLNTANVASVNLNATTSNTVLSNGNVEWLSGSFTRTDGTVGAISDIQFVEDYFHRKFVDAIPLTSEALALPDMAGSGRVRDLREAMSLSPELAQIVQQFANTTTKDAQLALLDQLLYTWAKTDPSFSCTLLTLPANISAGTGGDQPVYSIYVYPASQINLVDVSREVDPALANKISILESFNGTNVTGLNSGVGFWQVDYLNTAYDKLRQCVYDGLVTQTRLKPYLDALSITFDGSAVRLDMSGIRQLISDRLSLDYTGTLFDLVDLNFVYGEKLRTNGLDPLSSLADAVAIGGVTPELAAALANDGITLFDPAAGAIAGAILIGSGADENIPIAGGSTATYGGGGNDTITDNSGDDTIDGGSGNDVIIDYGSGTNLLRGGAGNDTITFSYTANNTVEGGEGDDSIQMETTNYLATSGCSNTLAGGAGNDRIVSGVSADTYLFNRGDGQDRINDFGGYASTIDKVVFGAGIAVSDVTLCRVDGNLLVTIANPASPGATDSITIESWGNASYRIEEFRFADGTVWSAQEIASASMTGTAGADTLMLWSDATWADGREGDDNINSGSSDATIFGGAGNDTITDSSGSDTVDGGDGNDVITDSGSGTNTLRGGAGNDTITFSYYANNTIEGGSGDDLIKMDSTTHGNTATCSNTFAGGAGNDRIQSGASADTYLFNRGDGQDTISDYSAGATTTDKLVFGAGITSGDLSLSRTGYSLVIKIADPNDPLATDQITIENWFSGTQYQIESFVFADGTSLTAAQVTQLGNVVVGTEGADTLSGFADNNTLLGLGGNDAITDSSGNDTIDGGDGNDVITDSGSGTNVLRGGAGNDTITFSYYASNTIEGGSGDDLIKMDSTAYATSASYGNTFAGGAGNDRIQSGVSADTYLFNRGDGQDTINDYGGAFAKTDKVVFGPGIAASDVTVSRVGANLVLTIIDPSNPGVTDSLTIENWDTSYYRIEQFQFADGTVWTAQNATTAAMTGTAGADTLTLWSDATWADGKEGDDRITSGYTNATIYGGAGNDTITDSSGNDTIDGGDGNDVITDSGSGTNVLLGGAGNDTITFSYYASNTIEGGSGDDLIKMDSTAYATSANYSNTFAGGAGDDRFVSGLSADTYLFSRGDGQDSIKDFGGYASTVDKVFFGTGIVLSDVTLCRVNGNLLLTITDPANPGATDSITIENWFSGAQYQIESFVFTDGTSLTAAQATQLGNIVVGTEGADTLSGFADNNTLLGLGGNDTITDGSGSDTIDGGDGNDVITDSGSGTNVLRGGAGNDTITFGYYASNTIEGGSGDDLIKMDYATYATSASYSNTFAGGAGNDRIQSGASADTYLFNHGDDRDTISDYGAGAATTDQIVFGPDINATQLWFRQVGNNLEVSVIGSGESVTVENWYASSNYHLEKFVTADGKTLLDSQVANLVNAMAAFAPPAPGETTLSPTYQNSLNSVIAANWQ